MKKITINENFEYLEKNIDKIKNLNEETEVRKLIRLFEFRLLNDTHLNISVKKILIDYLNGKINSKYYEIINTQYPDKDISEIYKLQYFDMKNGKKFSRYFKTKKAALNFKNKKIKN